MDSIRIEKQTTTCSLVLRLVDTYTGKSPITSGLQIVMDQVVQRPIMKQDGYVIYTNLPAGEYTCRLDASFYLPKNIQLTVDNKEPMHTISLQPNSSYPFGQSATYIRTAVRDCSGKLLSGAHITAVCTDEKHAKAVVAQEVESGAREIVLTQIKGKVIEGDVFLLRNRGNNEPDDEYCCICQQIDGFRSFMLDKPLLTNVQKGTRLITTVMTSTDRAGEAVLAFRNPPSKSFVVRLTIRYDNLITVREVEVKEAQSNYIGALQLGD